MKTPLDFSKITQAVNELKKQLPSESELAQRLTQQTLSWIDTIQEVKTWLAVQQCLQLIETEEQKTKQTNQNPLLKQIKDILSSTVDAEYKEAPPKTPELPAISKVTSPVQSSSPTILEKPIQLKETVSSALDENTARQYCWDLAHCSTQEKLTVSLRQQTAPTEQPQIGDIVLHGTTLTTSSTIWIAPTDTISAFSQLATVLPTINPNGQIWLNYSDVYTEASQHVGLSVPKWCQDKSGTELLWHRWIDLLYWTIMTPDYSVFVNGQKQQQLSTDRENVLKTLLTIYKDFEKGFNEPEKYTEYLGNNLHRLYAIFHQFLCAEDVVFNSVPKHVFANLRRCVDNIIQVWQQHLNIDEEHPTGPLNTRNRDTKEYLASITNHTDNMSNIKLSLQHAFSQKVKAEKSQVLYWVMPYWKQRSLPPTHHYFELKGRVLYCYE